MRSYACCCCVRVDGYFFRSLCLFARSFYLCGYLCNVCTANSTFLLFAHTHRGSPFDELSRNDFIPDGMMLCCILITHAYRITDAEIPFLFFRESNTDSMMLFLRYSIYILHLRDDADAGVVWRFLFAHSDAFCLSRIRNHSHTMPCRRANTFFYFFRFPLASLVSAAIGDGEDRAHSLIVWTNQMLSEALSWNWNDDFTKGTNVPDKRIGIYYLYRGSCTLYTTYMLSVRRRTAQGAP